MDKTIFSQYVIRLCMLWEQENWVLTLSIYINTYIYIYTVYGTNKRYQYISHAIMFDVTPILA